MNRQPSLQQVFEAQLQTLALTLRPSTVNQYRSAVRRFLAYLRATFPQLLHLSQLHRDPHLLGWFRSLCENQPSLSNETRFNLLVDLRRVLDGLAAEGHSVRPDLIVHQDFPPRGRYLPRPLPFHEDQLLQKELRRTDDLPANALLLIRATGMRVSECIHLSLNCLREVGPDQWALHVPLGKLHTERLVPIDLETRQVVGRLLALRAEGLPPRWVKAEGLLLPRCSGPYALYQPLRRALAAAAQRAGCSSHITVHRLRHSFATEMLRLGVSLPAVMQLLGHKDIRMTLRYIQVTQQDMQRQFHQARQNATQPHHLPTLSISKQVQGAGLAGITQALAATRHLLEMYRRQLGDEKTRRKLHRYDRRLLAIAAELGRLSSTDK